MPQMFLADAVKLMEDRPFQISVLPVTKEETGGTCRTFKVG